MAPHDLNYYCTYSAKHISQKCECLKQKMHEHALLNCSPPPNPGPAPFSTSINSINAVAVCCSPDDLDTTTHSKNNRLETKMVTENRHAASKSGVGCHYCLVVSRHPPYARGGKSGGCVRAYHLPPLVRVHARGIQQKSGCRFTQPAQTCIFFH